MAAEIRFGTDGWRAIIAEDFTFENVRFCAQAVADYLTKAGLSSRGLVVGFDTRFASENFAAAVAEVAAANGIRVWLCEKAAPTPVVSYSVLDKKAGGGVIITSSHNPASWNGFKYKPEYAGSAPPELTDGLEVRIEELQRGEAEVKRIPLVNGYRSGLIQPFDPDPVYLRHLAELVDIPRLIAGPGRIAVDSMYGAGIGYFRRLLDGGALKIEEIHAERNPLFPGMAPEPIPRNLSELIALVRDNPPFSIGLATDGDADRLGAVDENGTFLTQLQVFGMLALYLLEVRGERGALVKSVTTTSMIQRLGELYGVPVRETAVGFKYIAPIMMAENALVGGEESGGYGFRGHIPERDGILSGLYLLDFMSQSGMKASDLLQFLYQKVGPHHYDRADFPFDPKERPSLIKRVEESEGTTLDGVKITQRDTTDGFRYVLEDGSWLLIRFSGTEPLLRIYAETESPERVQRLLAEGKRLAGV